MSKFDEEVQVFYDRFDKAYENNDIKELGFFSQFCIEKDIRKWTNAHLRRQICENARNNVLWRKAGYDGAALNEHGWHEWIFPDCEEKQECVILGKTINRGCCNMKEDNAIGIMQIPNGKWIAEAGWIALSIGTDKMRLGIHHKHYDTRTEAWNAALKEFIEEWKSHNKDVKKDDEAVAKAKSLIIMDEHYFENTSAKKGEVIQLSLFDF